MIVELCPHREMKPHRFLRKHSEECHSPCMPTDCPGGRVLNQAIIWWCEVHRCSPHPDDPRRDRCPLGQWMDEYVGGEADCRFVEALLTLDALASAQENQP